MKKSMLSKTWWIVLVPLLLWVFYSLICSKIPEGPCPIEALLLDAEDLPGETWGETGSRSIKGAASRLGIERIGTSFINPEKGGINHDVYRFIDRSEATEGYKDLAGSWFYPNERRSDWIVPGQLELPSIGATQYQLGCSIYLPTGEERCQWIALYGTYTIFLIYTIYADTDVQNARYENIEIIINKIDQKMADCLQPQ